ncbi:MAG: hypothetical protein Q8O53_02445 [Candidatus Moranbacteria bacterium]|nr:hypothetical protein [Candidatus Moranbacteria bacterium]
MEIIGHHKQRAALREAVEHKAAAQAYLFVGPRGIGKRLCALEYAALLASEPDFMATENKPHPFDVLVLRPEQETKRGVAKTKNIAAEAVREALSFLGQFPAAGGFRTLIIEDAHRLSETAQNVLLKTLEEPPSTAVIILVTHEVGALLSTVLSRVKRVRFDFVPEAILRQEIAASYNEQELADIAPFFFALGRPGMILSAREYPQTFALERELLGQLFRLSTLSSAERLTLAEKLALHGERTIRLLEWWLPGLYHQAMKLEEKKGIVRFYSLLEEVEKTMRLLKTTQSNARLLLEKLFLSV